MIEQKLAAFAAKLRGESVECVEIVVVAETCQIIEQRAGGLVDLRSALFEQGGAGGKLGTALGSRLNLRDFLLCAVGNFLPAELRLLFSLSQNRGVCFFGVKPDGRDALVAVRLDAVDNGFSAVHDFTSLVSDF